MCLSPLLRGQALREGRLSRAELGWCHPYQPSLSASWLFQRSMSVAPGQLQRAPQPATERRAISGDTSSSNRNGTSGVDGSSSSSNLANGSSSSSSSNNQSSWPAWARLPAGHVNAVLACNFSVMKVRTCLVLRLVLLSMGLLPPVGRTAFAQQGCEYLAVALRRAGPRGLGAAAVLARHHTARAAGLGHDWHDAAQPAGCEPGAAAGARLHFSRGRKTVVVHSQRGHFQVRVCVACALGDCTYVCMRVGFETFAVHIFAMLMACCCHACVLQVGPATLLGWFRHFFALVAYTLLYAVLKPVLAVLPRNVREAYVVSVDFSISNSISNSGNAGTCCCGLKAIVTGAIDGLCASACWGRMR